MKGVGNQGERVGRVAENQFRDDERRIERRADGKGRAKTIRRVAVTSVIVPVPGPVPVIVRMRVIVMMVIVRHCKK